LIIATSLLLLRAASAEVWVVCWRNVCHCELRLLPAVPARNAFSADVFSAVPIVALLLLRLILLLLLLLLLFLFMSTCADVDTVLLLLLLQFLF
jgi:hypothetical protein